MRGVAASHCENSGGSCPAALTTTPCRSVVGTGVASWLLLHAVATVRDDQENQDSAHFPHHTTARRLLPFAGQSVASTSA